MSDITLRNANLADLEAVHAIDITLFPEGISYDMDTFYFYLTDPATDVIIAQSGEEVAGFLIFREHSRGKGCVVTIDVAEKFQRRGTGSNLIKEAERLAVENRFGSIVLQTAVDNRVAIHFYEKHGYSRSRRLKGYYDNGTDAWEMSRKVRR